MIVVLLTLPIPALFAICRRLMGGPLGSRFDSYALTYALGYFAAMYVFKDIGHGWAYSAIAAAVLAFLGLLHYAIDHADDWKEPLKRWNILRFSMVPLVFSIILMGLWLAGIVTVSAPLAALGCAIVGPASAVTYWFVQRPKIAEYLDNRPVVMMPWGQNKFLDGHLGYAELAFGLYWGIAYLVLYSVLSRVNIAF